MANDDLLIMPKVCLSLNSDKALGGAVSRADKVLRGGQ